MPNIQKYQIEFHKGGITVWGIDDVPDDPTDEGIERARLKQYDYTDPQVSQLTIERVTSIDRGGRSARGILLTAEGIHLERDGRSADPMESEFDYQDDVISMDADPSSATAETGFAPDPGQERHSDDDRPELEDVFPSLEDDDGASAVDAAGATSNTRPESTGERESGSVTESTADGTSGDGDAVSADNGGDDSVVDTESEDNTEDEMIDEELLDEFSEKGLAGSASTSHNVDERSPESEEDDTDGEEDEVIDDEVLEEFAEKGLIDSTSETSDADG